MSRPFRREFAGILRRLQMYGYRQPLESLSSTLDHKLWLIGGWVRSAFRGHAEYAGDVDCLCTLRDEEIVARLSVASRPFSRNRNNGIRVQLFDKNHIDVVPAEHYTPSGAIKDVLQHFNFSINSAAFKINEGTFECTQGFLEDVEARAFHLNDGYVRTPGQRTALFEDARTLIYYDRLRPAIHKPTADLLDEVKEERQSINRLSLAAKLDRAGRKVCELLGSQSRTWVVRGYLRCSLLGALEYWDDLDVVTELSKKDLYSSISQKGQRYLENYFGNPKIILDDGTTMDIWALPDGYRIQDELSGYSHNVDALAWHVDSRVMVDPLGVNLGAGANEVEVMERYIGAASKEELAYTSLKTAYLCLRHHLKVGPRALELLRSNLLINGFLQMNVARLSKKLSCAMRGKVMDSIEGLKIEVGGSQILDSMLHFISNDLVDKRERGVDGRCSPQE